MAAGPPPSAAASMVDRALFWQTHELAAARVRDVRLIARYQKVLTVSHELLRVERVSSVVTVEGDEGAKSKCLLLQPGVSISDTATWSDVLREAVAKEDLRLVPYQLALGYEHWTSRDVLMALLPEQFHDDIPTGFNTAGHVAHLNLRDRFLPYRFLVAQVLLDKNPQLRTVINKTNDVGTSSMFRTFPYEVLAGPDDLNVETRENGCSFAFDYSRVYWNSKLEREHTRLALGVFRPGDVVVDVMAGIGPFAVPAGRRGVFVWANDMNPASYDALREAICRNHVDAYVRPFNMDGRTFIHRAADLVQAAAAAGLDAAAVSRKPKRGIIKMKNDGGALEKEVPPRVAVSPTVAHFVMNLPASALAFLPRFRGVYAGAEDLFVDRVLPLVHVHCFAAKNEDDPEEPLRDVCARVSTQLGVPMARCARLEDVMADDHTYNHRIYVHFVRAVAPHKSMFCASFRLPEAVAFAARELADDTALTAIAEASELDEE